MTIRRLLILVQRLALREGRELVFEPNGPDLRRLLQTQVRVGAGLMFRLGALRRDDPGRRPTACSATRASTRRA